MAKKIDLTGQRFGRLVVISLNEEVSKQKKATYWNCRCDCGNESLVRVDSLRNGRTTSCGCWKSDKVKEKWKDEEFRQKQRNGTKEKWQDEEFRQKQRNGTKEKWQDEEFKQMKSDKMREMVKEKWQDEEYRQIKSDKMREMVKEKWQDEEFKQMKSDKIREQNPNWKGGITPISIYLRSLPVVSQWRKDTYTRENNKCQLTGKHVHGGNSDVHHLYGFNMIVIEAHELHNIQIHEIVSEYTQEELYKLEQYIEKWHKDTSNAVLLCEEVHSLFHSIYKYGNNTPEQYEEFKQRYLSGEFEENIK